MEVIGEFKDGYITKVDINELANLTGYNSKYTSGFKYPKIGDKIDIPSLYERVTKIENLIDSGLSDSIDDLNKKIKSLNVVKDIFKDIVTRKKETP
jgi:hypothetical protein